MTDAHGELSVLHVHEDAVGIASGLEGIAAALDAMECIAQQGAVGVKDFLVTHGCVGTNPAVFQVYSVVCGDHVFDDILQVVHLVVGIDGGVVLVGIGIVERTVSTLHLQAVHTVLQSRDGLVHVEGAAAPVLGSIHVAVGAVAVHHLPLPSLETIGEISVLQQDGYVCSCSGIYGHGLLFHLIDGFCHGQDILSVEAVVLCYIRIGAQRIVLAWLYGIFKEGEHRLHVSAAHLRQLGIDPGGGFLQFDIGLDVLGQTVEECLHGFVGRFQLAPGVHIFQLVQCRCHFVHQCGVGQRIAYFIALQLRVFGGHTGDVAFIVDTHIFGACSYHNTMGGVERGSIVGAQGLVPYSLLGNSTFVQTYTNLAAGQLLFGHQRTVAVAAGHFGRVDVINIVGVGSSARHPTDKFAAPCGVCCRHLAQGQAVYKVGVASHVGSESGHGATVGRAHHTLGDAVLIAAACAVP